MSREAIGAGRPVPELAWAAQNYAALIGSSRPPISRASINKPRKYALNVLPATGIDNPGYTREQEEKYAEYRGQPGSTRYYFYVD
jgi:hypothetical protein